VSFVVAMLAGTAIGLALGLVERLDHWLRPWLIILLNIPALVIIILSYVWLGLTETALLVAVALNKIPSVAVTLREGARALDRDFSEVAQVYRFGPVKTFRDVVLPQLAPYLLAAARNGLSLVWKIVLVAEYLGRPNGVGFEIGVAFQLFDIPLLLAYSLSFAGVVLVIETLLVQPFETRLTRWRLRAA
jgi:NitT/TauT family transport system permease protein